MRANGRLRKTLYRMEISSLLIILCAGVAWGGEDARTLLKESENRHRTQTQQYSGELSVVNKAGKVRKKGWKSFREGYAGDAKNLIRFTDPPEVKGVGFLSLAKPGKNPDQWLYLPSMKRERRIATQDRDASFVGTDFNYEDMEEFDHEKYKVALQKEQIVDGQPCHVIEAIPLEQEDHSVYEQKILYLRKDILYLLREDLYRKGDKEPSKQMILADIQNIDGHWVAMRMEMSDFGKGSKTTVIMKEVAINRPQAANRFTLRNLNREGGD